jgi:hypothetical protein
MQEMNNSVETSDLLETFDGMELIEATLLNNVSGGGMVMGSYCKR